jgi:hypothetical protein
MSILPEIANPPAHLALRGDIQRAPVRWFIESLSRSVRLLPVPALFQMSACDFLRADEDLIDAIAGHLSACGISLCTDGD